MTGAQNQKRPGTFNKAMSILVALLAIAALAFLVFLFLTAAFLPAWLQYVLTGMCAAMAIAVVWLLTVYLRP